MNIPETKYAKSGDAHIAYQVVGAGSVDLLVLNTLGAFESYWRHPLPTRFLERLASFARLILMDLRGTGFSDRSDRLPTFDQQMDDVLAVQDAAGSERSALFAMSQGGPLAMLFTASYPERVSALVLYAVYARLAQDTDYPWGRPPGFMDEFGKMLQPAWGTGVSLPLLAPSMADDEALRQWLGEAESALYSPAGLLAYLEIQKELDVRSVLPTIRVPTLVLQRTEDTFRDPGHSKYIAERIPGARLVELPGRDHAPFVGNADRLLDEIQEFLTGARPAPETDRVLATVMFTDIVGSTKRAAEIGDRRWRGLLQEHDDIARAQLERFRGREIKTTGDGLLATFDGPARAIQCATAIGERLQRLGLEVRAGLHTGEIELAGDDVRGIAVHIGARVASLARPGEVVVSSTVKDLVVGSGIEFEDRGSHELKGIPDEWRLFAVKG